MFGFQLGFKNKLRIVVALSLLGFTLLYLISFDTLEQLEQSSQRVDRYTENVHFLNTMQFDILQTSISHNAQSFDVLQQRYTSPLEQLSKVVNPEQKESIALIKHNIGLWVESHQTILMTLEQIGQSREQGLRAKLFQLMSELETKLFSNMKPEYRQLKQDVDAFLDQRGVEQQQKVQNSYQALKKKMDKFGFYKIYRDKMERVQETLTALFQAFALVNRISTEADTYYQTLITTTDQLDHELMTQLSDAQQVSSDASQQAKLMIPGVCIAVAIVVMGMLITVSRSVVSSLTRMSTVLHRLAEGDLTQELKMSPSNGEEINQVNSTVNEMTHTLNQVINGVIKTSQTLQDGAIELNHNLSEMVANNSATDQQAASVAVATEQINTMVKEMKEASASAHQQAQQAQYSADQGGEVITTAIDGLAQLASVFEALNQQVDELKNASNRVDGVTDMINDLAEQTNLLALNAAIEAARAGDAGRGFSVVADEVRTLAAKTVQATQNITDIIDAMQTGIQTLIITMQQGDKHVAQGRASGDKAVLALKNIKTLVVGVTEQNQELAANIADVATTSESISTSMDQVVIRVAQNTQKSLLIQEYVNQASTQTEALINMTERFNCQR